MQSSFLIGSLDLGFQPLYLSLTLYGYECVKCRSALTFSREAKFRRQKKAVEKKTIR